MSYRRFTAAEIEYLCKAWRTGATVREIARELGRSVLSVQRWTTRHAVRRDPRYRSAWHPNSPGRQALPLLVRYDDGRVRRFPTLRAASKALGVDLSDRLKHPGGYYLAHGFTILPDVPENAAYGKEYRAHPGLDCMDWPKALQDLPGAPSRGEFRWGR